MRASTLGCIIASPWPMGISRSAKARLRCSGGTNCSRLTWNKRSRTCGSSTSQVRICCSTMLKRACSMFMAPGSGLEDGAAEGRIVSNGGRLSVERALVALERRRRHHGEDQRERPDALRDVGEAAALEHNAAHDPQEMRERED